MWMPAIHPFCKHLLLGYVIAIIPITAAAFVIAGYINIPSINIQSYPWLWAILILVQAWCCLIQGSGSIAHVVRAIGATATICIVVVPWSVFLLQWLVVLVLILVGSYTIVCCMGVIFFTVVYPCVVNNNYTMRLHRVAARLPCATMMAVGMRLSRIITWFRPCVFMGQLCLKQLYLEYVGPAGSMTLINLPHTCSDLRCGILSHS